jgi:hypothetical protein
LIGHPYFPTNVVTVMLSSMAVKVPPVTVTPAFATRLSDGMEIQGTGKAFAVARR